MIALLQRVRHSAVRVEGEIVGEIGVGLNVLLGIFKDDDETDIALLVPKILHMRIFEDDEGKIGNI